VTASFAPLAVHVPTGLLAGVRQVLSPHCDPRPCDVDLVILHGISLPPGKFGGPEIEQLFTGHLPADAHPYFATIAGLRVSAHVLVRRDGEPVQFVPFGLRAWHAGASAFEGRSGCNDFSVGIELEGTDDSPYTDAQYQQAAALVRALARAYPAVTGARVVGHSDVAPGRKTDPGEAFDWPRMRALLG
jgi:N-acetyl-anhydromuramoyl-L-alanine amidase